MALTRYIRGAQIAGGGYYLNSAANDGSARGWKVNLTFRIPDPTADSYVLQENMSNTNGQWSLRLNKYENGYGLRVFTSYRGETHNTYSANASGGVWKIEQNKWYTFSFQAEAYKDSDSARYVYACIAPYGTTGTEISWKHNKQYSTVGGSKTRTIQLGNEGMDLAGRILVSGSTAGNYSPINSLNLDIETFLIGVEEKYSNGTYTYLTTTAIALAATLESVIHSNQWPYNQEVAVTLKGSGIESSYQYYVQCKFSSGSKYITSDILWPSFASDGTATITVSTDKINQLYKATNTNNITTTWSLVTMDNNNVDQGESVKTTTSMLSSAQSLKSINIFSPTDRLSIFTVDDDDVTAFYKLSGNCIGISFELDGYQGRDTSITVYWDSQRYTYNFTKDNLSGSIYLPLSEQMGSTLKLSYYFYNGYQTQYRIFGDIPLVDMPVPRLKDDGEIKMHFGSKTDEGFIIKPFGTDVEIYNDGNYSTLVNCVEFPSNITYYWGMDQVAKTYWYKCHWKILKDGVVIREVPSEPAASYTNLPLYVTGAEKQQTYVFTMDYSVALNVTETTPATEFFPVTVCSVLLTPTTFTMQARADKQGLSFGGPAPSEPGYVDCYWKLRIYNEETGELQPLSEITSATKAIPIHVIDNLF